MKTIEELQTNFETELKRGSLTLIILSQLREPKYGYSLLQDINQDTALIEAGTLYPMLRRLEKQGVLNSDWDTTDSHPRKYYYLSADGRLLFAHLKTVWVSINAHTQQLLEKDGKDGEDGTGYNS